jgi:hypothetical protein
MINPTPDVNCQYGAPMTYPAPLYDVAITYRTPSGRRVSFGRMLAYRPQEGGFDGMLHELLGELKYEKRRRVACVLPETLAFRFRTMQIARGFDDCTPDAWAVYLASAPRHYQTEWKDGEFSTMASIDSATGEALAMVHYIPCGAKAYQIKRGDSECI